MIKVVPRSSPNASRIPALSDPGQKALRLLRRGCAYRVHGAWRFRGSHAPVHNATLVNLVKRGLAEVVEVAGQTQIRITLAGISAKSGMKTAAVLTND